MSETSSVENDVYEMCHARRLNFYGLDNVYGNFIMLIKLTVRTLSSRSHSMVPLLANLGSVV